MKNRKDTIRACNTIRIIIPGIVMAAVLVAGVSAAGIQTSMGDTVSLSGYSYGGPNAYLYLTGPNLPVNGVALDNINRRADQGGFTIVPVDGNNHWTYKWNTANIGGRLDAGAYTIWVVNGPNDRSRLNEAEYSTISVTLGVPSISVNTPAVPAMLEITTTPPGAAVLLDSRFIGSTPLTKNDLTPGFYNLTLIKSGYQTIMTPVQLVEGRMTSVDAPLAPQTPATMTEVSSAILTAATPTNSGIPATPPALPVTTPRKAPIAPAAAFVALIAAGISAAGLRRRSS